MAAENGHTVILKCENFINSPTSRRDKVHNSAGRKKSNYDAPTIIIKLSRFSFLVPKLTTPNLTALIDDLEYCTRYSFAVMLLGENQGEPVQVNPNTVRSVITGSEQLAAPTNLTVSLYFYKFSFFEKKTVRIDVKENHYR